MAAARIDRMWDGWHATMSASFIRTNALLDDGNTSAAAEEFRSQFIPTMKTLYTNAANTAPNRYCNVDGWYDWTKYLYLVSVQAQKALEAGDLDEADRDLDLLRGHYDALHEKAGKRQAGDYIYEFDHQLNQPAPDAKILKSLAKQVGRAKPMVTEKMEKKAYKKAVKQWQAGVKKALKDKRLTAEEKQSLEQTTYELYKQYGMRLK